MRRNRTGPDETVGSIKNITCISSSTYYSGSWGDLPAAGYHFDFQGNGLLYAGSESTNGVRVNY